MIGQMLIMGFDSSEVSEASPVVEWIKKDGLGGVILFDTDFKTQQQRKNLVSKSQIKALNHQLQQYSQELSPLGKDFPLFISVDFEGGEVDRFKHISGCIPTKKPIEWASLSESQRALEATQMAKQLKLLGFNLNFSPCVDLSLNSHSGVIGCRGRSFSEVPAEVTQMASEFIQVFAGENIHCAMKHFPGHGSAREDSHKGFVDVSNTFQTAELLPFQKLIQSEYCPAFIMTAHVVNRTLDKSAQPATLSYKILTEILRHQMGYEGIIVTDDMQMHAISQHYSLNEALKQSIMAGADMLIYGNQMGDVSATELVDRIETLVVQEQIVKERIFDAFNRITRLKKHHCFHRKYTDAVKKA